MQLASLAMLNKTFSNTFKSCPNNKISRNKKYFGLAAIFLVTWRVRIAYALCSFVVLIFKRQASGCELRQKRRVNFRTSCKKYKTILMLHNNLGKVLYCLGSFYVCQVPIRPPSCQQTNETDHTRNTKSFTQKHLSRLFSCSSIFNRSFSFFCLLFTLVFCQFSL